MSDIDVPNDVRAKYLTRRQDEVNKIKESLSATPDWELINKVGHQIKGNAITFDFPELVPFGKKLEDIARNKDVSLALSCVQELEKQVISSMKGL